MKTSHCRQVEFILMNNYRTHVRTDTFVWMRLQQVVTLCFRRGAQIFLLILFAAGHRSLFHWCKRIHRSGCSSPTQIREYVNTRRTIHRPIHSQWPSVPCGWCTCLEFLATQCSVYVVAGFLLSAFRVSPVRCVISSLTLNAVLELSFCTVPLQQFPWQHHLNHIHSFIHSFIHSIRKPTAWLTAWSCCCLLVSSSCLRRCSASNILFSLSHTATTDTVTTVLAARYEIHTIMLHSSQCQSAGTAPRCCHSRDWWKRWDRVCQHVSSKEAVLVCGGKLIHFMSMTMTSSHLDTKICPRENKQITEHIMPWYSSLQLVV